MKHFLGIFILLFSGLLLQAQTSSNPFEITHRISKDTKSVEVVKPDTISIDTPQISNPPISVNTPINEEQEAVALPPNKNNPFEIISSSEKIVKTPPKNIPSSPPKEIEKEVEAIQKPRIKDKPSFLPNISPVGKTSGKRGQLFGIMLLTLVPVAILFTIFRSFFVKAYENIMSANILNRSYREYAGASIVPMNIWYVAFWLNLGIFISVLMNFYGAALTPNPLLNTAICVIGVSALIMLKRFALSFLALIFPIEKEVKLYKFLLMVFGIIMGIFLVPFNIAIIYASPNIVKTLVYIALAILGGFYILRSYRGLLVANRFISLHKFHFLLYICTVELAPLFILIKLGSIYLD